MSKQDYAPTIPAAVPQEGRSVEKVAILPKSARHARCVTLAKNHTIMGVMYDPDVAWFVLKHWDAIVGSVDFRDSGDFEAAPAAHRPLRYAVGDGVGCAAVGRCPQYTS